MTRPDTPWQRHRSHPTQVRPGRGPHAGEMYCVRCHCHIRWLSRGEYDTYVSVKKKAVNTQER